MLQIGTRVIARKNVFSWDNYFHQHLGGEGVITKIHDDGWISVKWDNGRGNVYTKDMLDEIIKEGEENMSWDEVQRLKNDQKYIEKKKEEKNKMYELPFLPGTRVCLNPESPNFTGLNSYVKGNAGYVKYITILEENLIDWTNISNKENVKVNVIFDNGFVQIIRNKDLLQVDVKPKNIKFYLFADGSKKYIIEGDKQAEKELDETVIKYNAKVYETKVYDDDWRNSIIKSILSNQNKEEKSKIEEIKLKKPIGWFEDM